MVLLLKEIGVTVGYVSIRGAFSLEMSCPMQKG